MTAATLSLSDRAGAENNGNGQAQSQDRRSKGRKSLGKTERGEVFENPNGTRSLVTWVDPADGQPTPNVKAKGKRVESESGGKTVSFAGDADEAETKDVVTVGSADEFFRLKLADSPTGKDGRKGHKIKKQKVDGNKVTFEGAVENGDLSYTVSPNHLKETIVLRGAPSGSGPVEYRFDMAAHGLVPHPVDNGVEMLNLKGDLIYKFADGPAFDSRGGQYTPGNSYSEVKVLAESAPNQGIQLVVKVDSAWLRDPARVYPVIIDPTTQVGRGSLLDVTNVSTGSLPPTGDQGWAEFGSWFGQDWNSFIRFGDLSAIPAGSTVQSATLNAFVRHCDNQQNSAAPYAFPIHVRRAVGGWQAGQLGWGATARRCGRRRCAASRLHVLGAVRRGKLGRRLVHQSGFQSGPAFRHGRTTGILRGARRRDAAVVHVDDRPVHALNVPGDHLHTTGCRHDDDSSRRFRYPGNQHARKPTHEPEFRVRYECVVAMFPARSLDIWSTRLHRPLTELGRQVCNDDHIECGGGVGVSDSSPYAAKS